MPAWNPSGASGGDSGYTAPILLNSWTNRGSGYEPAGFMKDASGFVHLRGRITGAALGVVAFIIPVGYRPLNTVAAPSAGTFNAGGAYQGTSWVYIDNTGQVAPQPGAGGPDVSLDGVVFLAGG